MWVRTVLLPPFSATLEWEEKKQLALMWSRHLRKVDGLSLDMMAAFYIHINPSKALVTERRY
jgi:hypothetical protein